ncbi:hypothetical protein ACVIEM_004529 [Rhizobium leguminosarum]
MLEQILAIHQERALAINRQAVEFAVDNIRVEVAWDEIGAVEIFGQLFRKIVEWIDISGLNEARNIDDVVLDDIIAARAGRELQEHLGGDVGFRDDLEFHFDAGFLGEFRQQFLDAIGGRVTFHQNRNMRSCIWLIGVLCDRRQGRRGRKCKRECK